MKDVTGKQLEVGDVVATNVAGYTQELRLAEIKSFTEKKMKLKLVNGLYEFLKFPEQVVKVNG